MKIKTKIYDNSFSCFSSEFLYLLTLLFLITCPIHTILAQPGVYETPENNTPSQLDKADLAPRSLDSNYHNEFWTYHFYFDNGMQLILRFSVANLGMARDPVSGAKISIINIPGSTQSFDASKQYPYKEHSYDTATSHLQLKEGKEVWFKGNINDQHTVKFDTNKDGDSYDVALKLFNTQPGFIPSPKGNDNVANTAFPNKDISVMVHVPYAETQGHVKINDQKYDVSGTVYMDHIYLNKSVASLLKSGMRFIHHHSDTSWIAGYVADAKDVANFPLIGYAMQRSNSKDRRVILPLNKVIKSSSSIDGRSYPSALDLIFTSQTRLSMDFTKVYQTISVLEDVGGFKKFLAKSYLGGEVINFRGIGKLNGSKDLYINYFQVD